MPPLPPRVLAVIREVSAETGVGELDIMGDCRVRHIARARMEAMCRARELPGRPSWPQIGRWFDGRDHTTVIHAWRAMRLGGATKKELLQSFGVFP